MNRNPRTTTDQAIPQELAGYRRAEGLAADYHFKWQIILCIGGGLIAGGLSGIFIVGGLWGERAGITAAIVGGCLVAWGLRSRHFKKQAIACSRCGQKMRVADMPMSKDQLMPLVDRSTQSLHYLFLHSFEGRDGYMYEMNHAGNRNIAFYRLLERWYACDMCKICFRAEQRVKEHVKTVNHNDAVRLKESLITDDSDASEFLNRLSESDSNARRL